MADNDNQDNKELRKKLEDALAENKTLANSVQQLQAQTLMPNLNERQRRVVMRELAEDSLDISEENVKQVAEDLGYSLTPESTTTNSDTTTTSSDTSSNNNEQDDEVSEEVMVSLQSMNAIDQANYNAQRGNLNADLETEMRNAPTKEALRQLIRTKGPQSGIVHEWDDE